jgi:alginate O-acetyltransferase complex protein AlgI
VIFTEFRFLLFFLIAFSVHWSLRGFRARKLWLLLCSNVFYAAWDWRFLFLLWASILIDYGVGSALGRTDDARKRKLLITASLLSNFGGLAFFKYTNFFIESGVEFAHWLGLDVSVHTLNIVLPVGISFYTFQSLSYTIDVYRRELPPVKKLLDLALFITFFTHLVAGPIVRAKYFLPQVFTPREWSKVTVRPYLTLFLVGFIKKACVSDNVVALADAYFKNPGEYNALGAWTGVLMYAVQIYCDFSGYTDMAIATAGLLGYQLQLNFNFPYFAANIREFWRRWHISLSTWLRDYLYIALGGSRGSRWFGYRNLMLTMLLGGLWHGAGWNFVIWGGMHGLALVAHREWERLSGGRKIPLFLSVPMTFWFACLAWIFFRAQTFSTAMIGVRSFVTFDSPGALSWGWKPFATLGVLALAHLIGSTHAVERWSERLPAWLYAITYGAAFAIVFAFMNGAVQPFIYFQF